MESSFVTHVLLLQQPPNSFDAFLESRPTFVQRYTESPELMRKECPGKSYLQPSFADGVEHAYLASQL